jgi:hypothetical protein
MPNKTTVKSAAAILLMDSPLKCKPVTGRREESIRRFYH